MGQILVRNINDAALQVLKASAKARGQSLEAVVRELIEREGARDIEAALEELRRIRELSPGVLAAMTADEYREGLE